MATKGRNAVSLAGTVRMPDPTRQFEMFFRKGWSDSRAAMRELMAEPKAIAEDLSREFVILATEDALASKEH